MLFRTKSILIFLFVFVTPIILAQSKSKTPPPDSSKTTVPLQVLEERVDNNAEKTQVQIEALQNEIETNDNYLQKNIEEVKENLKFEMYMYVAFIIALFVIIGSLITFFGKKAVSDWVKIEIKGKVKSSFNAYEPYINNEIQHIMDNIIEQSVKERNQRFNEIDKIRAEYESNAAILKERTKEVELKSDEYKKKTDEYKKQTDEMFKIFETNLQKLKDKEHYSANDWFLKGQNNYENNEYESAIENYTKAIEQDSTNFQ